MRLAALLVMLCASTTLADEIASDDCWDLGAGTACFTTDGSPGVCERQSSEWMDAQGVKHRQVNMVCVATATQQQRAQLAWFAAGVSFLVACIGWASVRGARHAARPVPTG